MTFYCKSIEEYQKKIFCTEIVAIEDLVEELPRMKKVALL